MPTPTNENTSKSTWLPERCRFFIATSLRKLLIRPDECAALARSAFPVGIRSLSKNWLDRFLIFANSLPLMQRDVNIVADRFSIRRSHRTCQEPDEGVRGGVHATAHTFVGS